MTPRSTGWSPLVTAEHGGNDVPAEYEALFRGQRKTLDSHRGWDPGTLVLARALAAAMDATLISSSVTRLLTDLNRSAHNPKVFSEFTRPLPRPERALLLERFHRPHWDRAKAAVSSGIAARGRVLHLGVHSFTPVLDGETRRADVALLYDPARPRERRLAEEWAEALATALPDRVVRRNYPYLGTADGMTTAFRRAYPAIRYLGLEIEVNQRHVGHDGTFPPWVEGALLATLREVL